MSNLYVACEFGAEKCRVYLGALQKEGLTVSEAGEFQDLVCAPEGVAQWDLPRIYQQVLRCLHGIVAQEEPVRGLSFHSGLTDSLLFESDGSLVSPAARLRDAAGAAELKKILAKIPAEELYGETGVQPYPGGWLCQLAAEPSRRIKKANHALSLPDALNYLFSGVAQTETSQAALSQLYNPATRSWSERLLAAANVTAKLMTTVVDSGTALGPVRDEVAHQNGLEDAQVVATCSYELAAALAALTIADPEPWAFLWPNQVTLLGTSFAAPYINDVSREMGYSNLLGYGGSGFYKSFAGLRLVDECRRTWSAQDRALDTEVLMHLATSAPPFEAFIDPADARFASGGDLPQIIQAVCRETGQEPPRKPGPILRCLFESLSLHYRRGLLELEYITSGSFSRLYVLGGQSNHLLNHFLANALQIPVVIVPDNLAAFGSVILQTLALGHVTSLEQAGELLRHSLKLHTIHPHATAWTEAYDRFLAISPALRTGNVSEA